MSEVFRGHVTLIIGNYHILSASRIGSFSLLCFCYSRVDFTIEPLF